ncbi:MAG: PaaI family thioesterase [Bdellovibrio sp.]|nr:PaaI family thioesterase [Bdellovibrio sp.]
MKESSNFEKMKEIFSRAAFVQDLGIEIVEAESGICRTRLKILPKHLQQTQVVHAGVVATLADHTAGGAATSLLKDGEFILTAEFKISLFRAATGNALTCVAKVLKPGKTLSFVESEVYSGDKSEVLVAKAMVTLAVLR